MREGKGAREGGNGRYAARGGACVRTCVRACGVPCLDVCLRVDCGCSERLWTGRKTMVLMMLYSSDAMV